MPNLTDLIRDAITELTCNRCSRTLPLTEENFFHRRRANGTVHVDTRCQQCRRIVDRENRARRAAGNPVRPRRARGIAGRRFGVEIEFIGGAAPVAREMTARGVRCNIEGYNHQVRSAWKIVSDASVSGGYELVSPPLSGDEGFRQLQVACEALEAAGASVNRACGLHVHHDVRDLDTSAFGRLFRGWSRNQRNTDGLVAASRRASQWAQPLREMEVLHIEEMPSMESSVVRNHLSGYRIDRYRALNVASFPRYGTVEVRQHQGTLNFAKIAAWVRFGQAFIVAAVAGEIVAAGSTDGLIDALQVGGRLSAETAAYLRTRAAHFARRSARAVA